MRFNLSNIWTNPYIFFMKIFPLLARSYDMRAIYGADFGDDDIRLVGQALGSWAPEGTIYLG